MGFRWQWVCCVEKKEWKFDHLMVHLGSEKEKEIERKREKEMIKNNKEKIKKGYLIEVVNFLKKNIYIEVIKNIIAVVAAAVEELVAAVVVAVAVVVIVVYYS